MIGCHANFGLLGEHAALRILRTICLRTICLRTSDRETLPLQGLLLYK